MDHYTRYDHQPPRGAIRHYFDTWAGKTDRDTVEMVEALLVNLNDEVDRLKNTFRSPDLLLDVAQQHFEKVQLRRLIEKAESYLEIGDASKARQLIETSRKIEIGLGAGIDVLADDAAMEVAAVRGSRTISQQSQAIAAAHRACKMAS